MSNPAEPPSICSACPELKFAYETCFHKWYNQFTAGHTTDLGCEREFQLYKECVWKSIEQKGIKENVMEIVETLQHEAEEGSKSSS